MFVSEVSQLVTVWCLWSYHHQICDDTIASLASDVAIATFVMETCRLVTSVATCMQTVIPHNPDAFPPEILTEWTELFSTSIYGVLLPLFSKVTGKSLFSLFYFKPNLRMLRVLSSTSPFYNHINLNIQCSEEGNIAFLLSCANVNGFWLPLNYCDLCDVKLISLTCSTFLQIFYLFLTFTVHNNVMLHICTDIIQV